MGLIPRRKPLVPFDERHREREIFRNPDHPREGKRHRVVAPDLEHPLRLPWDREHKMTALHPFAIDRGRVVADFGKVFAAEPRDRGQEFFG